MPTVETTVTADVEAIVEIFDVVKQAHRRKYGDDAPIPDDILDALAVVSLHLIDFSIEAN